MELSEDRIVNPCKIFIGGLGKNTMKSTLVEYFEQYGQVRECVIVMDHKTNVSRGFGFVTFAFPNDAEGVLKRRHKIDGVLVECRTALPLHQARCTAPYDAMYMPNKLFVGGIPRFIEEEEFLSIFSKFGNILDVSIAYDKHRHRPRGFGFIIYEDETSVEKGIGKHCIEGHWVEAKRAIPRAITRPKEKQIIEREKRMKKSLEITHPVYSLYSPVHTPVEGELMAIEPICMPSFISIPYDRSYIAMGAHNKYPNYVAYPTYAIVAPSRIYAEDFRNECDKSLLTSPTELYNYMIPHDTNTSCGYRPTLDYSEIHDGYDVSPISTSASSVTDFCCFTDKKNSMTL